MWDFDKSKQDDGIPDFLRRDANNVAPFMRVGVPEYVDDATDWVPTNRADETVNLSDSLPASSPSWVPPWASTS